MRNAQDNWNYKKYEDYHNCPRCNSKIVMRGQVNTTQTFYCVNEKCKYIFDLDVITGKATESNL